MAEVNQDPLSVLKELAKLKFNHLYYQLTSVSVEEMLAEARHAAKIVGKGFVVKILPTVEGYRVASVLSQEMAVCMTAVYSVHQAIVAKECGAKFVAVYVNRATRLMGDGITLVGEIVQALKPFSTEVLAASIKSLEEVDQIILAGVEHLTLSPNILFKLTYHELSEAAMESFSRR